MTRIAAVLGSVTPPGRLNAAVSAALKRANDAGHDVELLDLANLHLDFADGRPAAERDDDSAKVIEVLSSADVVLLASPVYRSTYTGALKNFLDLLPVESLLGKPVGIVAMGATQHHYLGVDFHLRNVLAWFGALVSPTSVYLASSDFVDGRPSEAAGQRIDQLFATLLILAKAIQSESLAPLPLSAQAKY